MSRRRKYNWEEWFSRPHTVLVRGVDYEISTVQMWQQVRNNAYARGIDFRLRASDDGNSLILEVIGARGGTRGELPVGGR